MSERQQSSGKNSPEDLGSGDDVRQRRQDVQVARPDNAQMQAANALLELASSPRQATVAAPLAGSLINVPAVQAGIDGDIAHWVVYAMLQTVLRESQLQQIASLANAMSSDDIVAAMLYLEDNQWDLGASLQQWQYDAQARAAALEHRQTTIDWNRSLDRHPARRGLPFNTTKLTIRVKKGPKWTEHEYVEGIGRQNEEGKAEREKFKITQPIELLRINRWRNRVLRRVPEYPPSKAEKKAGGKKGSQQNKEHRGEWWHPLQKRYLDKLYLETQEGAPKHAELTQRFNEAFSDRYLPSSTRLAPQRITQQLAGYLNRYWLDQFKKLTPRMKAREAKALIKKRQGYELAQLDTMLDEAFSSTVEDVDDVENEPEPVIANDGFPLSEADFEKYGEDKEKDDNEVEIGSDDDYDDDAPGEPDEGTYTPPARRLGRKQRRAGYGSETGGDFGSQTRKQKSSSTNTPVYQFAQQTGATEQQGQYNDPSEPEPEPEPAPRGLHIWFSLRLPEDFDDSLERNVQGRSIGPFYRSAALRDEIQVQQINIGDLARNPMTAEAWRRAGEIAMAFYWTREEQESIEDFNAFLNWIQAPVDLRADGTEMRDMLNFFAWRAQEG